MAVGLLVVATTLLLQHYEGMMKGNGTRWLGTLYLILHFDSMVSTWA